MREEGESARDDGSPVEVYRPPPVIDTRVQNFQLLGQGVGI